MSITVSYRSGEAKHASKGAWPSISMDRGQSIGKLKRRLGQAEGIQPCHLICKLEGKTELDDGQKLGDYVTGDACRIVYNVHVGRPHFSFCGCQFSILVRIMTNPPRDREIAVESPRVTVGTLKESIIAAEKISASHAFLLLAGTEAALDDTRALFQVKITASSRLVLKLTELPARTTGAGSCIAPAHLPSRGAPSYKRTFDQGALGSSIHHLLDRPFLAVDGPQATLGGGQIVPGTCPTQILPDGNCQMYITVRDAAGHVLVETPCDATDRAPAVQVLQEAAAIKAAAARDRVARARKELSAAESELATAEQEGVMAMRASGVGPASGEGDKGQAPSGPV